MRGSEQLNQLLAKRLGKALNYTEEETAVLAYGLFALLQTFLSIAAVIVIGLLLGIMLESLIISFSIALLRKFSGGAHATSAERCLCLGTLISILGALLGHLLESSLTIPLLSYIGLISFIWSFYIVYKKAPVASPNKPIKSGHKQQKLKQRSMLMILVYLVSVLLLLFIYFIKQTPSLLTYSLCLIFGMCWQVFTLTALGHKFAYYLDLSLIYISNTIKKGE